MVNKVFLVILAGVLAVIVVSRPHWLYENTFLQAFVGHEALALMAVILTVTLASVANIHMALNRIVIKRFNGHKQLKSASDTVKKEMRDNAWLIFWGFVITLVVLLAKGLNGDNITVLAICNAVVLWVLFMFILSMYDIYKVVFGIVDLESDVQATDGDGEDYRSESPEVDKS